MNKKNPTLLIYQSPTGQLEFQEDFERETIWENLTQIAMLFGVKIPTVSKHLKNIYAEGELEKEATLSILETVQKEGSRDVKRNIEFYNLDAILSVGYRVNSKQATQFRKWATQTLKQHLVDGYTINKNRISHNYDPFMRAVSDIKALLPGSENIQAEDALELISIFAATWFITTPKETVMRCSPI